MPDALIILALAKPEVRKVKTYRQTEKIFLYEVRVISSFPIFQSQIKYSKLVGEPGMACYREAHSKRHSKLRQAVLYFDIIRSCIKTKAINYSAEIINSCFWNEFSAYI
ncbi:MAG: hypothetical protein AUG74_10335 [Bacteroidetes bacterium 13_1_20CM_4_60_6]|nr:MAG: hypothetical protein AUG74_10335 [Bacteroidetes bacterium 13_1_20CM_4_60_6]